MLFHSQLFSLCTDSVILLIRCVFYNLLSNVGQQFQFFFSLLYITSLLFSILKPSNYRFYASSAILIDAFIAISRSLSCRPLLLHIQLPFVVAIVVVVLLLIIMVYKLWSFRFDVRIIYYSIIIATSKQKDHKYNYHINFSINLDVIYLTRATDFMLFLIFEV